MTFAGKDLNLLVALRALLEEANVTRAGERISMGQSSMSSALSRLRLQFNDELLVRVGRDYELTPLARLLLPQLQLTLPLIENALMSQEAFDPATSTRHYRLLMSDYAAIEMRPRLSQAMNEAPHIRIDILPLPAEPTDAGRDLVNNDFVVIVPGIGIEGDRAHLFVDHYVCMIDKNNPALQKGKLSWEAFKELPQAVVDFGQSHLTPADRKLGEMGFQRKAHVKTTEFMPMASIIEGTKLVGIVPSRLAERMSKSTNTIGVEAPFGHIEIFENLWWHPSHNTDPSHVWLRRILAGENSPAL
jgi:DNA-binding transcriptional LysR family regulator